MIQPTKSHYTAGARWLTVSAKGQCILYGIMSKQRILYLSFCVFPKVEKNDLNCVFLTQRTTECVSTWCCVWNINVKHSSFPWSIHAHIPTSSVHSNPHFHSTFLSNKLFLSCSNPALTVHNVWLVSYISEDMLTIGQTAWLKTKRRHRLWQISNSFPSKLKFWPFSHRSPV